ncbi:SHOCT domain-containing protein [Kitasatospora sp. NBC_01287]|uniref:SHOCT domain-containing protein n=1 Tax=Kitasatospora sp. NBC_01287 TaxID=2903573 RepID=UPI002257702C|nr:SHOCT domain-containing protein [Kitasatospora sp. NBC_01287]MCX4750845.1 SHOCT domain-containing protein [Kitasatospora sp. NBC_01287]
MNFHRYHHGGGIGGWHAGFWLFSIGGFVLLALLVVLIVLLVRLLGSRHHPASHGGAGAGGPGAGGPGASGGGEAERILGERYARGEIDEAEYQRRLRMLRDPGGPGGPGVPGGPPVGGPPGTG